jgi:hypothetical protein
MNNLVPGLFDHRYFYGKFAREYERLNREPSADNFLNFIVTANQLTDWIVYNKDGTINPVLSSEVKSDLTSSNENTDNAYLQIAADLANSFKHYKPTYPHRITKAVSWPPHSWFGTQGLNSSGAHVILKNDRCLMLKDVVDSVYWYWISKLGLPETRDLAH